MKLSVIVPCYNEEQVIEKTCKRLSEIVAPLMDKEQGQYELIFINDGSRDRTIEILKELAKDNESVAYLSFSRNFGKEAAMLAGLNYCTGDAVIIMDADLQHPPEMIPQMLEGYKEGYDQVIAKRNRVGDKPGRTFLSKMYYRLVNHLVDVEMVDGIGDFRLLSRKAVDALLSMREYSRFSKGMFAWIGFKQKVIEYENQERAGGETKWSIKSLLQYGVDGIMSFNDKPLRICLLWGSILVGVSFIYVIVILIRILCHGIDVPGYFTTIFAITMIGGTQMLSIGVLGEYIGRIYYEVKDRPSYLVDETNLPEPTESQRHHHYRK